jgi:serine/threonine protein kinase
MLLAFAVETPSLTQFNAVTSTNIDIWLLLLRRYELLMPKHTSLRHRVPAADDGFLDFLSYLLTPDPSARPSATEALLHPWLSHPYPPAADQIPD